jgi:hypothetical protein
MAAVTRTIATHCMRRSWLDGPLGMFPPFDATVASCGTDARSSRKAA